MKNTSIGLSVAAFALALATSATAKSSLYEIVPVPKSAGTFVFGINDGKGKNRNPNKDLITGSWLSANGKEHGFVGPVKGTRYTTFEDPNAPASGTEPRAINDNGYITGFSNALQHKPAAYVPFEREPDGTITDVTMDGVVLNYIAGGINNRNNEFAAGYVNNSNAYVGYLGQGGAYKEAIPLTGIANTGFAGRGIDNAGDIVGWYYDTNGVQHGFLISQGAAATIDPVETNLESNVLEGINDNGVITGQWTDTSGLIHSYTYNMKKGKFTDIKVPSAMTFVQAWGINDQGLVAVGSDAGYYIWCPPEARCPTGAQVFHRPAVKLKPQLQ